MVSGGDPGVFAMAAAVCGEIEAGPEAWRALDLVVVPGITAMLAVAARAGAPLGHDFCAISLSDNLKPWDLIERRAVAVIHPDLATSGGILETKKIGDLAQEHGIAMALHMAMSPIAALASVHCAAATENFMVLENHSVDELEGWSSLVDGLPRPLVEDGHIQVPETPGLGFSSINEELIREHLDSDDPVFFASTEAWDKERASDRLWS